MSLQEELKPILKWYKLVWRVSIAILPFAVAVGMYHGFMKGWQLFFAVFNTWVGLHNWTDGYVDIKAGKATGLSWASAMTGSFCLMLAGINIAFLLKAVI